jgi:hypothetical protein
VLSEAKVLIDNGEEDVSRGELEDASEKLKTARSLLEKAREILDGLDLSTPASGGFDLRFGGFLLPWWLLITIPVSAGGSLILIFISRKRNIPVLNKLSFLRPRIPSASKPSAAPRAAAPVASAGSQNAAEREKLERMLSVLERERSENIISEGAYNEMKKGIEKKLAKLG